MYRSWLSAGKNLGGDNMLLFSLFFLLFLENFRRGQQRLGGVMEATVVRGAPPSPPVAESQQKVP